MAKFRPWIVTPHTPLQKIDTNLWGVESSVPGMKVPRRMSIVRLADGGLIFYHAVPLDEPTLAEVLAWGTPKALVVGHHQHGIDAQAFAEKLKIGIYGPARSEDKLRKRWPMLAGTLNALPKDPGCTFEELDGSKLGEPVQLVRSEGRLSLVWCDAFGAMDDSDISFISRLVGFGGGPKVPPLFKLFLTSDKKALRAHLERLAALPELHRLVPCHGKIISVDAAGVLKRAAATV